MPNSVLTALHSIEHVQGVTVIYANPGPSENQPGSPDSLLVACDQLAHTPALGRCPPGAAVVAISGSLDSGTITGKSSLATRVWPAAAISPAELPRLPAQAIVVGTNGSRTAIERARTTLELAWPNGRAGHSRRDQRQQHSHRQRAAADDKRGDPRQSGDRRLQPGGQRDRWVSTTANVPSASCV